MKNWHGILKIIEIAHLNVLGEEIWSARNVFNLLHEEGEEFLLRAAFTGGPVSTVIPEEYYLGLDNRSTPLAADTMDDLVGEPTSNGYARQPISSSGDFSINFESNHFIATSPIVAFRATGGNWGPVSNLFLTTSDDNTGFLISTAPLTAPVTVNSGESITMRIGLQLRSCGS